MSWVLWLVGLAVVAGFALVALGAFGGLADEDDFNAEGWRDLPGRRIPLALFGYRRDVVDRLLDQLQAAAAKSDDRDR